MENKMTSQVLQQLIIIFVLAFLVESFVEYVFGTPMDKIPKLTPYKWLLMYLALAAGVGLAFYYRLDMISLLPGEYPITPVGIILSGLILGRGAVFTHQFVSQFFPSAEQTAERKALGGSK
jgi:hypothetical protein